MGFIETERANLVAWLFFDAGSVRQCIVDATPVEMNGDMPWSEWNSHQDGMATIDL